MDTAVSRPELLLVADAVARQARMSHQVKPLMKMVLSQL